MEEGKSIKNIGPPIPKRVKELSSGDFESFDKHNRTHEAEPNMSVLETNALTKLPSARRYEQSFSHRAQVTHVAFAKTDFAITASSDGVIKFWILLAAEERKPRELHFAKQFAAHKGALDGFAVSRDGFLFASTSASDDSVRFFDVVNCDMTSFAELAFKPGVCEWVHKKQTAARGVLAMF